MKKETYKQARDRIWKELWKFDWIIRDKDINAKPLKYPYAVNIQNTHKVKLWFKRQSVYMGETTMNQARSICSDMREMTGKELNDAVERFINPTLKEGNIKAGNPRLGFGAR